MTFPNDHLQYAITWYGLAAALLGIFLLSALHRFRERHDKAA
jgi:surfeit locus 1 family protein